MTGTINKNNNGILVIKSSYTDDDGLYLFCEKYLPGPPLGGPLLGDWQELLVGPDPHNKKKCCDSPQCNLLLILRTVQQVAMAGVLMYLCGPYSIELESRLSDLEELSSTVM